MLADGITAASSAHHTERKFGVSSKKAAALNYIIFRYDGRAQFVQMEHRLISLVLGYTNSADSSDAAAVRRCENEWQFKVQEAAQRKPHRLTDQRTHAWIISAKDCSAHTRVTCPLRVTDCLPATLSISLIVPQQRTSMTTADTAVSCQKAKLLRPRASRPMPLIERFCGFKHARVAPCIKAIFCDLILRTAG